MITIDNIDFQPIRKHNNIIPNYYVSKCGKVWNSKSQKFITPYKNYRNNKIVDKKPKCMSFSMTAKGKPYWDMGLKYKPKKNAPDLVEFRMKLHIAVIDAWKPYRDYLDTLTREELIELAQENMLVDHIDDDITNNHYDNLQYSTPLKNSNFRKIW
tara:strand:- start:389 stop:856 length:468 start_codon:yes stop_codon:yes gene_type:complete